MEQRACASDLVIYGLSKCFEDYIFSGSEHRVHFRAKQACTANCSHKSWNNN